MKKYFITATDTNAGKTTLACALLQYFNAQGLKTVASKPLASGCFLENNLLYNEDALALQKNASVLVEYPVCNPIAFQEPIAPSIAAYKQNVPLNAKLLLEKMQAVLSIECDRQLIEGAGGLLIPLNPNETLADFIALVKASILLVVPVRLGCINHALLTFAEIEKRQLPISGWFANCLDDSSLEIEAQINEIVQHSKSPLLGRLDAKAQLKLTQVGETLL